MKLEFICFSFIVISFTAGFAQEICNNGIDDDWDGLIDLQDDECQCGLGLAPNTLPNVIPNSNFDTSSCCSNSISLSNAMNCVDDWQLGQIGNLFFPFSTMAYTNSCNNCEYPAAFIPGNVVAPSVVPNPAMGTQMGNISPTECFQSGSNGMLSLFNIT